LTVRRWAINDSTFFSDRFSGGR